MQMTNVVPIRDTLKINLSYLEKQSDTDILQVAKSLILIHNITDCSIQDLQIVTNSDYYVLVYEGNIHGAINTTNFEDVWLSPYMANKWKDRI